MSDKLRAAAQAALDWLKDEKLNCHTYIDDIQFDKDREKLAEALEAALAEPAIKESLTVAEPVAWISPLETKNDMVNHPPHYTSGGIETIDFIEAKQLGYHLGQVIKYVSRAGKKGDALEDLKKARWYLDREIGRMEGKNS